MCVPRIIFIWIFILEYFKVDDTYYLLEQKSNALSDKVVQYSAVNMDAYAFDGSVSEHSLCKPHVLCLKFIPPDWARKNQDKKDRVKQSLLFSLPAFCCCFLFLSLLCVQICLLFVFNNLTSFSESFMRCLCLTSWR